MTASRSEPEYSLVLRDDEPDGVGIPDAASVSDTGAVYQGILQLIAVRSLFLVGMALASKFPTEDDFHELLRSEDFIDAMSAFAEVKTDIALQSAVGEAVDRDAVAQAAADHQQRALEAVEVLSDRLGVAPEDLISVLLRA